MAKDILLFGYIGEYNAMFFFDQINEAMETNSEEVLDLRVSTDGGSPDFMMSIVEKVQELADKMTFKGGSKLHSAGFFAMCYLPKDRVSCMDTAQAVVHRAAYPSWIEGDTSFKGSVNETLMINANKNLEKAFRASVNIEVFEALPQMKEKNYTTKDIFSIDSRVEVVLTAKDLKAIGLVGKINKITPTKTIEAKIAAFNQCKTLDEFKLAAQAISTDKNEKPEPQITKIMTLAELRAAHPELCAQIKAEGVAEGKTAGVTAEKERVAAWEAWREVDPEAVSKAVVEGKEIKMSDISALSAKAASPARLQKLNADAAAAVASGETPVLDTTKTPAQLAAEKKLGAIEASLDKSLGLSK